ncbi:uncharacterized protein LOC116144901 [Pistacia vera]|uniref:uncharacterized protein LOC116144901 n=1 Tax=Pistacia vera TaxID=55513 RepID=UPI001263B612|nr:uncharacterized protein LOC116144901 [Pistacia vera]
MHRTWNPWLHFGRRRMRSPEANSDRQITHSVSSPGSFKSGEKFTIVKVLRAFCFTPVLASLAEELALDLEATSVEHLRAHLMMEFNPREQIRAQSRTERTITTLASKLLSPV